MKRVLFSALIAGLVSACGGGGSGDSGESASTGGSDASRASGSFVDSPVAGLGYRFGGGDGITDAGGGFETLGEITFDIGDITLGSAQPAAFLTPVDLVPGAGQESDPAANRVVTNLARLLQTLDSDGNVNNGIQISPQARAAGAGRTLDFDQPVADFEADPAVQAFLDAAAQGETQGETQGDSQNSRNRRSAQQSSPELVSAEQARAHLSATLEHIAEFGAPNRLPNSDAGADQAAQSGQQVTLDGSASTDPDPEDESNPIAAFAWQQVAGPIVDLQGADTVNPTFTPQVAGDVTLVFELTVSDDDGGQNSDQVEVAVSVGDDPQPGNNAPVADDASLQTVQEQPATGQAVASDADGDDLELRVIDAPQNGGLEFAPDGSFTYSPDAGFSGDDFFTFRANDGADDSNLATVTITVNPIVAGRIMSGAAKRVVTPSQEHIDGVTEERLGGAPHQQRFNLGGFGIDPLQNFPDPVGGFGAQLTEPAGDRVYRDDDTWVRTLILSLRNDDGTDTRIAFVTLDAVGAGNIIQNGLKAAVSEATGIPEDNVLFGQTHSHAGADLQGLWGGVPQDWIDDPAEGDGLYQLAADSAAEAMNNLRVARLDVSTRELPQFNNYRRPEVDPNAEADPTATLLRVRAADDNALIGSLLQYNAHPTSIGTNDHEGVDDLAGRVPHPDYITGITRNLESEGGVALFYNGPIADASGRSGGAPAGENPYEDVRNRGQALAAAAAEAQARSLSDDLAVRHTEVILPVTNPLFLTAGALGSFNRYYDFLEIPFADIPGVGPFAAGAASNLPQATPTATTLVSRITLGSGDDALEIVTIPGEATNTFGEYIQNLAGKQTMLLGLTQNSFGYILPEEEFSYLSETGDTGLIVPFTNYEEFVSLGPLTAPLLRIQGYNPLFDAPPEANVPPALAACFGVDSGDDCILEDIARRPDFIQRAYGETCRDNGLPEEFCSLIDPGALGALAQQCRANDGPEALCDALGGAQPPGGGGGDAVDPELVATAAESSIRGCDILDPAHCMMPFPSDHFTTAATPGTIQSAEAGGTGRRVNINILGMPRNTTGKPVNPLEWNRNDGFSPGQLITTVVPGLAFDEQTGAVAGAPPITNIQESLFNQNASVMVIDADTGARHLVWAEMDLNAGFFLPSEGIEDPTPEPPALMIRPAKNFEEGHRYIVVLRDMRNDAGELIPANPAFAACRDATGNPLPQVSERCAALEADVFAPLAVASATNPLVDVARDETLFLAWDFTVSSQQSLTARLLHMRDDAFASLDGGAPPFTVDTVTENPNSLTARRIQGTLTVPSYLVPSDGAPPDTEALQDLLGQIEDNAPDAFDTVFDGIDLASNANLPPNRLFYNPTDGGLGTNPPFGDGLPDRTGDLTVDYICNVPRAAVSEAGAGQLALNEPARPSLYGHGLLGGGGEVNNTSHVATMSNAHNVMFCAIDWYGFASADVPNVLTTLIDLSLFPLVPDGSQQGILNFMFLGRLLSHDQGFAADPAFQVDGQPVFDRREVFYDGNSQGGILGGVVLAASPDVHRGVLGVPGMNYSTLLRRSVDFDIFSIPLYLSYTSTLDRTFLFSFMEMVWERSENNGFAAHLNKDPLPGLDGEPLPIKRALLHPAYADHQVTMWSADVMARTMLAAVDGSRTDRHPDQVPFDFLDPIENEYVLDPVTNSRRFDGSALVIWDQPWTTTVADRCEGNVTPVPPVGNVPPRDGDDPHECPRREVAAQCQKSHFMHREGAVIDVSGVNSRADCPALPPLGTPPGPPDVTPPDGGGDGDGGDGNPFAACADDPAAQACPLAPVAGLLDPDAVTGLIDDLQQCQPDDTGAQCVTDALVGACQPKVTAEQCATGEVVAGVLEAFDQPITPSDGDPDPNPDALGDSYAVYIEAPDGETIAFQVHEPDADAASLDGFYPLVLEGHGYGMSRTAERGGFADLLTAGYGVVSIDQRGFGESSGTVRSMDPDFEGQNLIALLDWAEENLEWIAYDADAMPDTGSGRGNPLVGAIGSSYGGGYQLLLLNIDPKQRLDALVPDITWHDLRFSLNPGDVPKSGWSLALSAVGEAGSNGQQDPFIKETLARAAATGIFPADSLAWFNYHGPDYFCGAQADDPLVTQRRTVYPRLGDFPGSTVERRQPPAADILFTQGFRDTLFNVNEAFWNYQCYSSRGGDVRLYTHQTGHILPFPSVGSTNPLAGGENPGALLDTANRNCGGVPVGRPAEIAWFDQHLKGIDGAADAALGSNANFCLSLSGDDSEYVDEMQVGGSGFDITGPLGGTLLARTGPAGAVPQVVELGTIAEGGDVLAGIPRADLRVTLPGGTVPDVASPEPDLARPFDSILFVGIGRRAAGGAGFELIDDQLLPLRGLGDFPVNLIGVAERVNAGDTLGLMIWGQHAQYPSSFSRDPSVALVELTGSVEVPLLDANLVEDPDGGDGGEGGDDPLAACQNDPASEACPLSPLTGLLSPEAVAACGEDVTGADCPLAPVVEPVADNDPIGLTQVLAAVAGNVTGCVEAADPLTCQQALANAVEAAAVAAGLPLSQEPNRCDTPAGEPDPVNESLEWQLRDLTNMLCATQRMVDMAANPAFNQRFGQETPRNFSDNVFDQLDEPTRPAITLAQLVPGGTTADPYRQIEDWEANGRGQWQEISFIATDGAKLNGRLLTPNPSETIQPPYPAVVITTGSIQGYQEMYNWAAQGLAEAGYMVLTYDVQGQGESETFPHEPDGSLACDPSGCQGVPFQQSQNFFQGARDSLDFLLSTPDDPYANAVPAADPDNANAEGTNEFNPLWNELNRSRIGLAGHSLGASAISVVGQNRGCDPQTPFDQRDGCVSAIVGWDAVAQVDETEVDLRVPALSLTAEYFFNPTPKNSMDPPDPATGLGAYEQLKNAGVDAMRVALRSSTHLEWTYVPYILPASRYGERVSMHYTLAWMDRYVRGDDNATARLTTTEFGASADASSIGAGTYDVQNNRNVPYRIEGDCVANRVSIYENSAYFLNGGAANNEDLRARACDGG